MKPSLFKPNFKIPRGYTLTLTFTHMLSLSFIHLDLCLPLTNKHFLPIFLYIYHLSLIFHASFSLLSLKSLSLSLLQTGALLCLIFLYFFISPFFAILHKKSFSDFALEKVGVAKQTTRQSFPHFVKF